MQGYAAPEQTSRQEGSEMTSISTRHTAVDVFGLGMLAFYVFTGRDPRANEHQFPNFKETIADSLRRRLKGIPDWKLLPEEISYLISHCTKENQSERPAFGDVVEKLRIIKQIALTSAIEITNPMLLREIVYRISGSGSIINNYEFGRRVSCQSSNKEYFLSIVAFNLKPAIKFRIERHYAESDTTKTIYKYMPRKLNRISALLRKNHGKEIRFDSQLGFSYIEAIFQIMDITPTKLQSLINVFMDALANFEI